MMRKETRNPRDEGTHAAGGLVDLSPPRLQETGSIVRGRRGRLAPMAGCGRGNSSEVVGTVLSAIHTRSSVHERYYSPCFLRRLLVGWLARVRRWR